MPLNLEEFFAKTWALVNKPRPQVLYMSQASCQELGDDLERDPAWSKHVRVERDETGRVTGISW